MLFRSKEIEKELLIRWYIIGDGPDFKKAMKMVRRYGLGENVFLLGEQKNPFTYMKNMDLFFLPSKYEGKPISVTEAQILGLPTFVTEYASAREQIEDGVDGVIIKNDDEHLFAALRLINTKKWDLKAMRSNVEQKDYSNLHELSKVYSLINE